MKSEICGGPEGFLEIANHLATVTFVDRRAIVVNSQQIPAEYNTLRAKKNPPRMLELL